MSLNLKILLICLLLNIAAAGMGVWKGYEWGAASVQAKWDKASAATINSKIETKAKQDEIQIAPIDHRVTNRRLLNATF